MPGTYCDQYVIACRSIQLELCKLKKSSKVVSSPGNCTGTTVVSRALTMTV